MRTAAGREWPWVLGSLAVATVLGLALPLLIRSLAVAGRFIPQDRIEYDYLMGLIWATTIGISIRFWPVKQHDKRALTILWIAKVLVTLGAMLVYEWNYGLDAYHYFAVSLSPQFPEATSSLAAGTVAVTRFAWLHSWVMPDSYHAMKVTFAAIGLVAVYLMYRGAVRFRRVEDTRILYVLGLFPSILFWSSILGKEPIHILGIGLYAYGVLSWRSTGQLRHVLLIAMGVAIAFVIRSWSAPILLFPLLVFALTGLRKPWMRVAGGMAALAGFLWTVSQFAATFNIETLGDIQTAAEARSQGWGGSAAAERTSAFTSVGSMLRFAPVGAFAALFRPFPGEVRNPFGVLAGLENIVLLGLLLMAIIRFRLARFRDPALLWASVLIVTWSFVYSFVSYYNFGAAVRFKLQILPILLLVLLHLAGFGPQPRSSLAVSRDPAPA